jgi:hypothetical protein
MIRAAIGVWGKARGGVSGAIATTSNAASRFDRYESYEDSLRDSTLAIDGLAPAF